MNAGNGAGASAERPADLLIVGGGINGAGIARDAAGRGLSVVLCEQDDLASATSSASTKLIHGGLRYLEYLELRLVREALRERELLLAAAPHIVRPLTFVLPHAPELRPAWMLRIGLFLYDHLAGRRRLHASRGVDLRRDPLGAPLKDEWRKGFVYADCWVDDARLVLLNVLDAAERGAQVMVRTRCTEARREQDLWRARLQPADGGPPREVWTRALVNAAGPWVTRVLDGVVGLNRPAGLRLVKGSHIVVPRLFAGEHAYILQNDDRRQVFAIPFEEAFTLIGTTEVPWEDDPAAAAIDAAEAEYLCRAVNRYFRQRVAPTDAVWSFSGVRPLYDDMQAEASAVTRDYVFDVDAGSGRAPILSVFGGKLTTYRKLAEHALAKLSPHLRGGHLPPTWTAGAPLPGGDLPAGGVAAHAQALRRARPWLPEALARRYARSYGTRAERILAEARSLDDLGESFGAGLYAAEVDYLVSEEWARTAEDVLWRRSKLGLFVEAAAAERLAAFLDGAGSGRAAAP